LGERGGEEVMSKFQICEGVDDQRPVGAEGTAHRGERLPGHQMRGAGIAQEGVENNSVVFATAFIKIIAPVAKDDVQLLWLKVEVLRRARNHCRVDLHDVYMRA